MRKETLDFLMRIRSKRLNKIMVFITHLGTGGALWIFMSIVFLLINERKLSLNIVFSLLINGIICNLTLKPLLKRKRPSWVENVELLIKNPKDFSFPSGHTTSSFAAAVTIFYYYKYLGIFFIIIAVLIGFSRIYHFVHHPSDVIIGMILGIIMGIISFYIFNKYIIDLLDESLPYLLK